MIKPLSRLFIHLRNVVNKTPKTFVLNKQFDTFECDSEMKVSFRLVYKLLL